MRAAKLSLQKYNYLLYFQIVLQVHIRRLHPDFFLFTCLLLPRAPSLLLDASLRSNNKRLLMRIQSSFADFHSLFNKPISSPCAPLTQRNYGNMTDNNAIVITTAWPSWRAACQCFMDDSDFICGKTFISVFVDCGQKLVYGLRPPGSKSFKGLGLCTFSASVLVNTVAGDKKCCWQNCFVLLL